MTQTLTWIYICSQWSIFHGPVVLPYILKTIWWTIVIIGILVQCDAKIYLVKCMWVSDLHCMVQCFCLLSWRQYDGLMLYWSFWFSVTQTLTWNYICRSLTYISWSSDFALYLEDYLMDKCHNWNVRSMWCKDFPHKMYVRQWPAFHGPVIPSYILKTFWWRNVDWRYWFSVTLSLTYKYVCRSVTYISWYTVTLILPYIFNTIWWTSLILCILVQCDMGY